MAKKEESKSRLRRRGSSFLSGLRDAADDYVQGVGRQLEAVKNVGSDAGRLAVNVGETVREATDTAISGTFGAAALGADEVFEVATVPAAMLAERAKDVGDFLSVE